ncbi:MAG: hypothetical protein HQ579_07975 [Candidatus Omnitrophica bacterium]|nr:hypothetical protein [Candidatus Omnitrophota bacterium]
MFKKPIAVFFIGALYFVVYLAGLLLLAVLPPKEIGNPTLLILTSLYAAACSIGLCFLKNWGRILTITSSSFLFFVALIFGAVVVALGGISEETVPLILFIVLQIAITVYLLLPVVKKHFVSHKMKEYKKSNSITTFTVWFFVFCILLLCGAIWHLNLNFLQKSFRILLFSLSVVLGVSGIAFGINLLKMREWARRWLVILSAASFVYIAVTIPLNHKAIRSFSENQINKYNIEINDKADIDKTSKNYLGNAIGKIVTCYIVMGIIELVARSGLAALKVIEVFVLLYLLLVIFYFTRIRIKEHFR